MASGNPKRLRIGVAQAEKSWIGPVMGPAVVLRERFGGEDPWDLSVFETILAGNKIII